MACGEEPDDPHREDEPCLIVEVLSPTTESTDRREKLLSYRTIPSLQAYLIVEQERTMVERHFRDERGQWQTELINEGDFLVPCPPGAELLLSNVYDGV